MKDVIVATATPGDVDELVRKMKLGDAPEIAIDMIDGPFRQWIALLEKWKPHVGPNEFASATADLCANMISELALNMESDTDGIFGVAQHMVNTMAGTLAENLSAVTAADGVETRQ
jgi:hypothetical protein